MNGPQTTVNWYKTVDYYHKSLHPHWIWSSINLFVLRVWLYSSSSWNNFLLDINEKKKYILDMFLLYWLFSIDQSIDEFFYVTLPIISVYLIHQFLYIYILSVICCIWSIKSKIFWSNVRSRMEHQLYTYKYTRINLSE